MSIGKIVRFSFQVVTLLWLSSLQTFACDCGLISIPDMPGETDEKHFERQMQAQIESSDIVVAGRFISVKDSSEFFGRTWPSGRFQVSKTIKGDTSPFMTIYTDMNTNCRTPWMFTQALKRRNTMVISVRPHKGWWRTAYEIDQCNIFYYPADRGKLAFPAGAAKP